MDCGSPRPGPVAVPLEKVDFAVRERGRIQGPERGPGPGSETVELYPGFPGVAHGSPKVALNFAAEVVAVFFRGAEDEIGVAVEEHVAAIIAVVVLNRRVDVLTPVKHEPLRRIGR